MSDLAWGFFQPASPPVGTNRFLRIEDLLLPAPLPAVVSLVVVLALWGWGLWLTRRAFPGQRGGALEAAAGFVLATGALSAVVHGLGLAGLARLPLLRPVGLAVTVTGLWHAIHGARGAVHRFAGAMGATWRESPPLDRAAFAIAILIIALLGLASLAPPTDSDSLFYHLGVPLQWLRAEGITPLPDWLHARLVGLGESTILMGLALGTDSLGAVLGWVGLVIACVATASCVRRPSDRPFGILLAAACPVMLYLTTTQKAQLLPAAASLLAILLLRRHRRRPGTGIFVLSFGCAAFAAGCKHTFLTSAGLVLIFGLWTAFRTRRIGRGVAVAFLAAACLPGPVLVRNAALYGDPVSPFLERCKPRPDPVLVSFSWYLRNFDRHRTLRNLVRLPVTLLIPTRPGSASAVLGVGALSVLLAFHRGLRTDRTLFLAALLLGTVTVVLGQWSPRFFVEPYLWGVASVAGECRRKPARVILGGLLAQGLLVAGFAGYGAWKLFPGALRPAWREQVMTRFATEYAMTRWLDRVLPPHATILLNGVYRNYAFLPRPFAPSDSLLHLARSKATRDDEDRYLARMLDRYHVNVLVIDPELTTDPVTRLAAQSAGDIAEPAIFLDTSRNPFNVGKPFRIQAVPYTAGAPWRIE